MDKTAGFQTDKFREDIMGTEFPITLHCLPNHLSPQDPDDQETHISSGYFESPTVLSTMLSLSPPPNTTLSKILDAFSL